MHVMIAHLRRSAGFTLIEVLVAVSILSIILACLYSSFFLARRAIDSVDNTLIGLQGSRILLDAMRREIEAATFSKEKRYTVFTVDDRDFFGKQASRIVFTTFCPLVPGLARIEYSVEEREGVLSLKKTVTPAYRDSDEPAFVLMERVDSFTIETKSQGKWVKSWNSQLSGQAPQEVRITITLPAERDEKQGAAQSILPLFETVTLYTGKAI
jgi:general secretion pathway protein J